MIIVNYTYYKNEYGGLIDEVTFNKYLRQANIIVDSYCFNRLYNAVESDFNEFELQKIRDCLCAVTEIISSNVDEQGIVLASKKSSETVGPWSVSFSESSGYSNTDAEIFAKVKLYLSGLSLTCSWI